MIISYSPIHHVEEFEGQLAYDRARAERIARTAERHGVFTRMKHDGDTSYLEAPISLASLTFSAEGRPEITDRSDEQSWRSYVEFLAELEDSNVGYLLHEVDTVSERALLATLLPVGADPRSLAQVNIVFHGFL